MNMSGNIPQSRQNSMFNLDPIDKTDSRVTLNVSENDRNEHNNVKFNDVGRAVPSGHNALQQRGPAVSNNVDPSPEWITANLHTTPPPSRPKSTEVINSPYLLSSPAIKKKSKSKAKVRHRRVRPCLTVEMSKAKSGAEVLRISLEELGWRWREVCGARKNSCDLYWHGCSFYDNDGIQSGMVNKFPGLLELVRKAQLSKLLHQMYELFPEEFDFYPRTWLLPEQYHHFCANVAEMQQKHPHNKPVFIVKPDEGSQGDGIYLITNPHHMGSVGLVRRAVVQEYIARPLLLERTKFDLRVYVLLASIDPLQIYICREGMARFCTMKYQLPTNRNIHQVFMHLTNYSLNKKSDTFVHTDSIDRGSKRTLTSTFTALASRGYDTIGLWYAIEEIVVKTITAMLPDLTVELQAELPAKKPAPSCFQILGFDILVTDQLKPILLEVNANPSLRLDFEHEVSPGIVESKPSPVDEEIKIPLIKDTLRLIKPGKNAKEFKPRHTLSNSDGPHQPQAAVRSATPNSDKASDDEAGKEGEALDESCLEEIWPRKYGERYSHLRVMEHVAGLFNQFLGVKGAHRMGATGFRMFSRKCKLCSNGITMAGIDIMYIDITRRWTLDSHEGIGAGMCFGAFLEGFFSIAMRKFRGNSLLEKVSALVEVCECNLKNTGARPTPRPHPRRLRRPEMVRHRVAGRWPTSED